MLVHTAFYVMCWEETFYVMCWEETEHSLDRKEKTMLNGGQHALVLS